MDDKWITSLVMNKINSSVDSDYEKVCTTQWWFLKKITKVFLSQPMRDHGYKTSIPDKYNILTIVGEIRTL